MIVEFGNVQVRIPKGYRKRDDGNFVNGHGVEYALVAYGNGEDRTICLETIYSKHVRTVELEVVGVEEEMEICPICGASIEVKDGEDNGYGELHLYWKCKSCGNSGTAIIDEHDNNAFVGHEID